MKQKTLILISMFITVLICTSTIVTFSSIFQYVAMICCTSPVIYFLLYIMVAWTEECDKVRKTNYQKSIGK